MTSRRFSLRNMCKFVGGREILCDINFDLMEAQTAVLLGKSGSGKSTLLRCIAGLEKIDRGEIKIGDVLVSSPLRHLAPEKRKVGIVFQDYSLFPHWTVYENLRFPVRKLNKEQREKQIEKWLDVVQLTELANRYPHELSGGEQQRVALARALVHSPNILLLDESFSSLDDKLRLRLAREVRELVRYEGSSALLVTHDQVEAFSFADQMGVLHEGRIAQWGTPYELYHSPRSEYLAHFIGEGTLIEGTISDDLSGIHSELGFIARADLQRFSAHQKVKLLFRPDDIFYSPTSKIKYRILEKDFRGANFYYKLELKNQKKMLMQATSHHHFDVGSEVGVELDLKDVVVISEETS